MVAGDDQAALEASRLIDNVTTVAVKTAISRSAAKTLTPAKSKLLLAEAASEAIKNRSLVKPLVPPKRPVLRIEFVNYGQAEWANLMPGTELIEGTTIVKFEAEDILQAYQAMLVMTELAMRTTFS